MFLAEGIVRNFVASIEDDDFAMIESLDDTKAFDYICDLYQRSYGVGPSGTGIYLLRTQFQLGSEEFNIRYIPKALL